jgi:hypothetical protein
MEVGGGLVYEKEELGRGMYEYEERRKVGMCGRNRRRDVLE